MLCPTCAQPAQGSERFCNYCGTELATAPPVAPAAPAEAASAAVAPAMSTQPQASELRGVGGWLLLFCIWITVIDPLWDLRLVFYLHYGFQVPLLLSFGLTLYGVVTGIQLWIGAKAALVFLRVYFAAVLLLSLWGFVTSFRETHAVGFNFWLITAWFRVAAFLAVWVTYFRVSVRVRATYGANL
ncbi:MAG: hypothetical protein HYX28_09640 [Candidatus Koribacter versatilis]|uniref:Zinc-ribbon domain-containing protein n=1 Tax=Candidatus Korobacter versatilis TaxID=658062 RepID=A0A932A988_9BACT|nr:hypothetical protein [Candidatus Koribacter versatilis]